MPSGSIGRLQPDFQHNTIKKERSASPWALDPEPLYKMGALRRPLGFPVPQPECRSQSAGLPDPGGAIRTGSQTPAPRDPAVGSNNLAPTRPAPRSTAPLVQPLPDGPHPILP